MTRTRIHFTENQDVGKLLELFPLNQGPLFHYFENPNIAASIVTQKELQVTRSDCFVDKEEVKYGIGILNTAAECLMNDLEYSTFHKIFQSLPDRMHHSYIYCFSQNGDSDFLKKKFGKTIVEFPENFPTRLEDSWHLIPSGDGFELRFELYDLYEGSVVYETEKQKSIAKDICRTFIKILPEQIHIVDSIHFLNIILGFISLTKQSSLSDEQEYRAILVAKPNNSEQIKLEMNDGERFYIKLKLPGSIELKI